ncbi:MAG: hypothetical protein EPN21_09695 [Methylococcaceae bacterium]|nr:MAG: hypothetical protein EPN21_09695 [Methylococcaceae bacterium]
MSNITTTENIYTFDDHSYFLAPTGLSWKESEAYAVTQGGHLVSINSQEEQNFLEETFRSGVVKWIGLTDEAIEGTFVWTSGESVIYTNWDRPEPNNYTGYSWKGEDYGMIYLSNAYSSGKWNDLHNAGDPWPPGQGIRGIVEISNAMPTNATPNGKVTITGAAMQGQTLTAANNLADADGLGAITYQWQTGTTVLGTGDSYTVTAAEIGKTITATASYTDGKGTLESVTSTATAAVIRAATAGFNIVAAGNTNTGEDGATASFAVSLNTQLIRDVTLGFASSDTSEGVIDTPIMTFTSSTWDTPQTLTVRGIDDFLDDHDVSYSITGSVKTIDVNYKLLTVAPLTLVNRDDGLDGAREIYGDQGGSRVDVLQGSNGPDVIYGLNMADDISGGIGDDTLWGGYGKDNLFGEDGNDKLSGEQDEDYLEGGAGSDTLDGGDGVDTMIGGVGNDVYYLGYDAPDVITDDGLPGDKDTVIMPYQLSKYTLPSGIENGAIAAGTQNSSLTGNSGNNALSGNDGNNGLNGGVGRDSLFGGEGTDILTGGTGTDFFDFNAADESGIDKTRDVIADFKAGEGDKIDLAGIDANSAGAGNQAFTFINGDAFNAAGQLRFDAALHVLYGNTDADTAPEFSIQLNGVASLSAAGLVL